MLGQADQTRFKAFMPHGPGIMCIERVLEITKQSTLCRSLPKYFDESMAWTDDNQKIYFSSCQCLEHIAQASLAGLITDLLVGCPNNQRDLKTQPPGGMIVKVDFLSTANAYLQEDETLLVQANWESLSMGAYKVAGTVTTEESSRIVGESKFTILEPPRGM